MPLKHLLSVLALGLVAVSTGAQQSSSDKTSAVRVFLNAEIGATVNLGYFPTSVLSGPSVEIPAGHLFEFQSDALFSNDRRVLTVASNEIGVGGTGIVWATHTLGVTGGYDYHWLSSRQFGRTGSRVGPGLVIRDNLAYPGRTYLGYSFVSGCMWGIPSNPCQIEPATTREFDVAQEFGILRYAKLGLHGSVLHYCDTPIPGSAPATCRYGMSEYLSLSFELKGRHINVSY